MLQNKIGHRVWRKSKQNCSQHEWITESACVCELFKYIFPSIDRHRRIFRYISKIATSRANATAAVAVECNFSNIYFFPEYLNIWLAIFGLKVKIEFLLLFFSQLNSMNCSVEIIFSLLCQHKCVCSNVSMLTFPFGHRFFLLLLSPKSHNEGPILG